MPVNKISATLVQADVQDVLTSIAAINTKLPFLINLTEEDKKSLPRFGDKSMAFVAKALELASQNPDFLPKNFDVAEFKKDVDLYNQLYSVLQPLAILLDKVEDTYKEAGAEAYSAALFVYNLAKVSGADLGGFDSVLDSLGKRFVKKTVASNGSKVPA